LFNVHGVSGVSQAEIHTTETLVPEKAIEKLKRYKSPGIDQIPAELIKVAGKTVHTEIHKLINLIWNEEELPEEWKKSITAPI